MDFLHPILHLIGLRDSLMSLLVRGFIYRKTILDADMGVRREFAGFVGAASWQLISSHIRKANELKRNPIASLPPKAPVLLPEYLDAGRFALPNRMSPLLKDPFLMSSKRAIQLLPASAKNNNSQLITDSVGLKSKVCRTPFSSSKANSSVLNGNISGLQAASGFEAPPPSTMQSNNSDLVPSFLQVSIYNNPQGFGVQAPAHVRSARAPLGSASIPNSLSQCQTICTDIAELSAEFSDMDRAVRTLKTGVEAFVMPTRIGAYILPATSQQFDAVTAEALLENFKVLGLGAVLPASKGGCLSTSIESWMLKRQTLSAANPTALGGSNFNTVANGEKFSVEMASGAVMPISTLNKLDDLRKKTAEFPKDSVEESRLVITAGDLRDELLKLYFENLTLKEELNTTKLNSKSQGTGGIDKVKALESKIARLSDSFEKLSRAKSDSEGRLASLTRERNEAQYKVKELLEKLGKAAGSQAPRLDKLEELVDRSQRALTMLQSDATLLRQMYNHQLTVEVELRCRNEELGKKVDDLKEETRQVEIQKHNVVQEQQKTSNLVFKAIAAREAAVASYREIRSQLGSSTNLLSNSVSVLDNLHEEIIQNAENERSSRIQLQAEAHRVSQLEVQLYITLKYLQLKTGVENPPCLEQMAREVGLPMPSLGPVPKEPQIVAEALPSIIVVESTKSQITDLIDKINTLKKKAPPSPKLFIQKPPSPSHQTSDVTRGVSAPGVLSIASNSMIDSSRDQIAARALLKKISSSIPQDDINLQQQKPDDKPSSISIKNIGSVNSPSRVLSQSSPPLKTYDYSQKFSSVSRTNHHHVSNSQENQGSVVLAPPLPHSLSLRQGRSLKYSRHNSVNINPQANAEATANFGDSDSTSPVSVSNNHGSLRTVGTWNGNKSIASTKLLLDVSGVEANLAEIVSYEAIWPDGKPPSNN